MRSSRQRLRLAILRAFAALPRRPIRSAREPASASAPRLLPGERQPLRILLIRPDHIGDLLFATPAIRVLRSACPDGHLTAMVGPWGKEVIQDNPNLDRIIICEFPAFSRKPRTSLLAPYRLARQWAAQLRSQRFDMAIVLRFDHWWGALLAHLARIPQRLGYAFPECQPFLSQAIPYESHRHEVYQNLKLVEAAVCSMGGSIAEDPLSLDLTIREEDHQYIARYLSERQVGQEEPLIAIHPGAGAPVKQWLPEAWAKVGDALAASSPARIVITGSYDELDLAWSVGARMRSEAIVAAGDTSLGQLAALFRRCRLAIGPDCGPLHLAVAVGTPTVHLYGPVDAAKFGPWGPPQKHVVVTSDRTCIPCNRLDYSADELPAHRCIRDIAPENVREAAQRLLAQSNT